LIKNTKDDKYTQPLPLWANHGLYPLPDVARKVSHQFSTEATRPTLKDKQAEKAVFQICVSSKGLTQPSEPV